MQIRNILIILTIGFSLPCFPQYGSINSGQKIPKQEVINKDCLDNNTTSIRLLGKEPHVPFAIIDKDTIYSAGQACCVEWASSKKHWYNLNKWGEIVGKSEIESGDGYDATQCFELDLKTTDGEDGIGLFTSKMIDWELPEKLKWNPTKTESVSFDKFIQDLENLVIDKTQQTFVDSTYQGERITFKVILDNGNFDTLRCISYGRRFLVIAYLDKSNNWVLAHLDNKDTNDPFKVFKPYAIMDIDKDGVPEIIYQESFGHAFWDKILKLEQGYYIDNWQTIAVSVGGATI